MSIIYVIICTNSRWGETICKCWRTNEKWGKITLLYNYQKRLKQVCVKSAQNQWRESMEIMVDNENWMLFPTHNLIDLNRSFFKLSDVKGEKLHNLFTFGIEGRCGLIQQKNLGISDQSSGDCHSLFLSSWELCPFVSTKSIIALKNKITWNYPFSILFLFCIN